MRWRSAAQVTKAAVHRVERLRNSSTGPFSTKRWLPPLGRHRRSKEKHTGSGTAIQSLGVATSGGQNHSRCCPFSSLEAERREVVLHRGFEQFQVQHDLFPSPDRLIRKQCIGFP